MIRFQCCHCGHPIEAPEEMIEWEIECSNCRQVVDTRILKRLDLANRPRSVSHVPLSAAEKIERSARGLMFLAGLCAVVSVVVGFFSVVAAKSGEDAGSGWWMAGALIGAAFWLYLLAQIVHIRALLAKK